MKRKALFISIHYEPEPNFIVTDLARGLVKVGWQVSVVTTYPNYPYGKFYPGTRWYLPSIERRDGVKILRVPHFPDHSLSIVKRTLSYLSFAIMAGFFSPFFCVAPRVTWVYQTPFSTALASLVFKFFYRSKLIYMYADLWPESFLATATVSQNWIIKICKIYRRFVNLFADRIVGSTAGTCDVIRRENPGKEIRHIPVWVDGVPDFDQLPISDSTNQIVYAGNLGRAQNLTTLITAAKVIQEKGIDIKFAIYGSGSEEESLKNLAHSLEIKNLEFKGRVSGAEAFKALVNSLAQVVMLEPSLYFEQTVPSKLFSAFAAGSPILAGLQGESLRIAISSGGGFEFKSDDVNSLVESILKVHSLSAESRKRIRDEMRKLYRAEYSKDALLNRQIEVCSYM